MTEYLGCKHCPDLVEVSDEDPDSSLSEAAAHQRSRHGIFDFALAMASVTEVTQCPTSSRG
jgi:hypothetical protein